MVRNRIKTEDNYYDHYLDNRQSQTSDLFKMTKYANKNSTIPFDVSNIYNTEENENRRQP